VSRWRDEARAALALYAEDVRMHGARPLSYTDLAVMLGKPPSAARRLSPLLGALRQECLARGLPDLCAMIVAAGTDMPSRKSFDTLSGTWCDTGLDAAGVRAEQAALRAVDWTRI